MSKDIKLAPSILSADFSSLGHQITELNKYDIDNIHIDVMDGHFVPNITIGSVVVKSIRPFTRLPFHVHMMVHSPDKFIPDFVNAGADRIIIHLEAAIDIHKSIFQIKELGIEVGIAINPTTSIDLIKPILADVDEILIMSVNPGFGGQKFIPSSLEKINKLRLEIDQLDLDIDIGVDGGINLETAPLVSKSGANLLVAGSAILGNDFPIKDNIKNIKAVLNY
ncbi:MAG: ribulose-phosphate 3-epimerase [Dehalococcoidia bacterium]